MKRRFAPLAALLLAGLLCWSGPGFAMVTDDAETLGKGRGQVDLSLEISIERDDSDGDVPTRNAETEASLSATIGLTEDLDLSVELPYQWQSAYADGQLLSRNDGLSDMSIDLKWRFLAREGWSLALKPGLSLPTGHDEKGLGGGRTDWRLYFITTRELAPWAFHMNLGYQRNENTSGDRTDLWHVSAAAELNLTRELKIGLDLGMERNPTPSRSIHPAFALAEVSYDLAEGLSIEADLKFGLTPAAKDVTGLVSITYKF